MKTNNRVFAFCLALCGAGFSAQAFALDGPHKGSYEATKIEFDNLVGVLDIEVGGSTIELEITGKEEELEKMSVSVRNNVLVIESDRRHRRVRGDLEDYASFTLTVPSGTDIQIEDFVGNAEIGNIVSNLEIDASAFNAIIGNVKVAEIEISGSGDIVIGDIEEDLTLDIAGAGELDARSARSADIDISGSGDVGLGALRGGLTADIAGSGDVEAASVNGPVSVDVAGSGSVYIKGGEADPLKVRIMGSGDFTLLGNAVDPDISSFGSGRIRLGSYTGKLSSKGQSNLTIGE